MTSAIVVARSGSKRLPGKALLPFAGSTLVGHKVRQLRQCLSIDRVYVGSDSPEILEQGKKHGAVPILRDAYHCDESQCSANEMIEDMASKVEGDLVVWAHPTNPLVKPATYDAAITAYFRGRNEGFDSLLSVTEIRRHAWMYGRPFNFNPWGRVHPTAKHLTSMEFQDGAIFIQPREAMVENRYFYGRKPVLFPVDAVEGWDVDTKEDYEAAVALWGWRGEVLQI